MKIIFSEERRKKIGEANKRRIISIETKEKLSKAKKGKHLSEDHKRKIGEAHKGKKVSEETRKKQSEAHKGKNTWSKGKKLSEEHKIKLSEAHRGKIPWNKGKLCKPISKEHKKKISEASKGNKYCFGKVCSEETRIKRSIALKGRIFSEEHKRKIGEANKGKPNAWLGKSREPFSKEHRRKLSKSRLGKCKGDQHPNWQGGKSFKIYGLDWTIKLRRAIRERDHYSCQFCGALQDNIAFDVHHIDYKRTHNDSMNLILLCRSCHAKTNFRRNYWINYFQNKSLKRVINFG